MVRALLFSFVVYQLFTLQSGTSLVANGMLGAAAAAVALVVAVILWWVIHESETAYVPIWRKFF